MLNIRRGYQVSHAAEGWRGLYGLLQEAQKQYADEYPIATELERRHGAKAIQEAKSLHARDILNGITGEYEAAIGDYQAAGQRVKAEKAAEVKRWSPDKLFSEIRLHEKLLEGAILARDNSAWGGQGSRIQNVKAIYEEALQSGDLHKMRGAMEATLPLMAGFLASHPDDSERMEANSLYHQVERDRDKLRITPGMEAAEKVEDEAADAVLQKRGELVEVGSFMEGMNVENVFSSGPYSREARRVSVVNRRLVVHAPDSAEVTGIDWRNFNLEEPTSGGKS